MILLYCNAMKNLLLSKEDDEIVFHPHKTEEVSSRKIGQKGQVDPFGTNEENRSTGRY